MTPPWYLLLESGTYENSGVVLIGDRDFVAINLLRRGILDARIAITTEEYIPERCTGLLDGKFYSLSEKERSESTERKRQLLALRLPGLRSLLRRVRWLIQRDATFPIDMDWYMAREIEKSPGGRLSTGILDYAAMGDRSPEEIYEYFKLTVEENSQKRLLLHAFVEKHVAALNTCMTAKEAERTCRVMWRELMN